MQEKKKILSPKLDVIFQALFGEIGSETITKGLLECILKKEIKKINLNTNPILNREFKDDKLGILDILVELNEKEICNIEMQVVDKKDIINRLLYYWARIYTRQLTKVKQYKNLQKTISILIADFKIRGLEKLNYHSSWKIIEETNKKIILTNKLEIHIIEIPKIINKEEPNDELLAWLYFLENPESKGVEKKMKTHEAIELARQKLILLSQDEKMQRIAELREKAIRDEQAVYDKGIDDGIEQGIKQGIKQGKKSSKIEIAQNMLSKKMDISLISEITGFSIEEIKKLKNT